MDTKIMLFGIVILEITILVAVAKVHRAIDRLPIVKPAIVKPISTSTSTCCQDYGPIYKPVFYEHEHE